jgi:hypothetical protein
MPANCSFCVQQTESHLLAVSSKVPMARICDKCLFKEMEKLLGRDENLGSALDRLERENRAIWTHLTASVEARVQILNSSALALDAELGGLRDMKKQLHEALQQHQNTGGQLREGGAAPASSGKDLRASAVKRLVDERMSPAGRTSETATN